MKRVFYSACAVLMTGTAAAIWYAFGFSTWTVVVGLLLLACPIAVITVAVREQRRTQREIQSAVAQELRRRQSQGNPRSGTTRR
jgi:lipopolysaccharide export LptBFGC system permease protein LptF